MDAKKLDYNFYQRPDVVQIAEELVGKVLCSQIGDAPVTSGIIVETEAYCGRNDKACHANNGLRTDRTETMYQAGGVAYIYLCYGIHHLFNVVTNEKDKADAVLIRAIQPLDGIDTILSRRKAEKIRPPVSAGPGRLTQALGITTDLSGANLTDSIIWIEDRNISIKDTDIKSTPRIGVDYAGEHANRPWRFSLKNSDWVSQ
ncbi:MAG TPA: DNA-3-methyladenine glycosylase [Balneolaceae bacterium]|nr:DNA-3-methyladenine glycosylase [Balneolaceae bacterium]